MYKPYVDVLKEMTFPQANVVRDYSLTLSEEQGKYIQEFERLLEKDYNNMDAIVEQFLQEFKIGNMDKVTKAFSKNMIVAKKFLYDHGITISQLNGYRDKAVKMIRDGYKSKKDPKVVTTNVLNKVVVVAIKKSIKGAKFKEEETADPSILEKIVNSLALIVAIILIQGILTVIIGGPLSLILSPALLSQVALIIVATVVAPITEEYAKRLAIQEKYPWVFTGIFSVVEGLGYVMILIQAGAKIPAVIIIRLASIMLHFTTTYIQKTLSDKVKAEELDEKWDIIGYYVAVGVHATWNSLALIYNQKISTLAGISV